MHLSELTEEDLLPMSVNGSAGSGGVYDALSARLPGLKWEETVPALPDGYNVYVYGHGLVLTDITSFYRYEGYWLNGMPNGEGTLYQIFDDRVTEMQVYTGTFINGYMHGEAKTTNHLKPGYEHGGSLIFTWDIVVDMGHSIYESYTNDSPLIYVPPPDMIFGVPPWNN